MGLLTRGVQLLQADLCFPLTHTLRFYRSSSRLKGLVTPALSQIHIFSERTKRSPSHVVSKLLPCFHQHQTLLRVRVGYQLDRLLPSALSQPRLVLSTTGRHVATS